MRRVIIALLGLIGLAVVLLYDPYILTMMANNAISASGVMLLMPADDVVKLLGEDHLLHQGMGGYGYEFAKHQLSISFSDDSDAIAFHKVSYISTKNPEHNIYGVQVGDSFEQAASILINNGFKQNPQYLESFTKNSLYIDLFCSTHGAHENVTDIKKITAIRLGLRDKRISDRVY